MGNTLLQCGGRDAAQDSVAGDNKDSEEAAPPPVKVRQIKKINYAELERQMRRKKKRGVKMPLVGVLRGKLSNEQLLDIWTRHDPSGKGEIQVEDAMPLVQEVIELILVLLQRSAQEAIQPLADFARVSKDEEMRMESDQLHKEYEDLVEPLLTDISRRFDELDEQRLLALKLKLADVLDDDGNGAIDKYEFIAFFAPYDEEEEKEEKEAEKDFTWRSNVW